MTDPRFISIPATQFYLGLVKRRIGQTERCIQVYGSGPEAERLADEMVRKVEGL